MGQSVSMTCTISDLDATGHTINPIMTWNASITGQSPINPINTLSTTSFSSTLIVQATLATLPYLSEYTCTTGFVRSLPIPTNKPGYLYADNIAKLTPSDSFHQLIVKCKYGIDYQSQSFRFNQLLLNGFKKTCLQIQ